MESDFQQSDLLFTKKDLMLFHMLLSNNIPPSIAINAIILNQQRTNMFNPNNLYNLSHSKYYETSINHSSPNNICENSEDFNGELNSILNDSSNLSYKNNYKKEKGILDDYINCYMCKNRHLLKSDIESGKKFAKEGNKLIYLEDSLTEKLHPFKPVHFLSRSSQVYKTISGDSNLCRSLKHIDFAKRNEKTKSLDLADEEVSHFMNNTTGSNSSENDEISNTSYGNYDVVFQDSTNLNNSKKDESKHLYSSNLSNLNVDSINDLNILNCTNLKVVSPELNLSDHEINSQGDVYEVTPSLSTTDYCIDNFYLNSANINTNIAKLESQRANMVSEMGDILKEHLFLIRLLRQIILQKEYILQNQSILNILDFRIAANKANMINLLNQSQFNYMTSNSTEFIMAHNFERHTLNEESNLNELTALSDCLKSMMRDHSCSLMTSYQDHPTDVYRNNS